MSVLQLVVDTEFTDIDVPNPQLISLGASIIDQNLDEEFYGEFYFDESKCSDFTRNVVLPRLTRQKLNFYDFIFWVERIRDRYSYTGHVEFIVESKCDIDIIEEEIRRMQLGCEEMLINFSFRFRLLRDFIGHNVSQHFHLYASANEKSAVERRSIQLYRHLCEFSGEHELLHNALFDAQMQRKALNYVLKIISRGEI